MKHPVLKLLVLAFVMLPLIALVTLGDWLGPRLARVSWERISRV